MCHVDVTDEVAGTRHETKDIDCITCHGASRDHVRDENNHVKPDRVFARKDIDPFCGSCHRCSRPGATRKPPGSKTDHKTCTECHGAHKIVRRN